MKKIVITFGLISGAISSIMMVGTVPFADSIGWVVTLSSKKFLAFVRA